MLKLHFSGYGAAYYPPFGNTSAWFVKDRCFWLIDCGEDVFGKIYTLPQYREADEILVILTHMHSDHTGSLGTLISYTNHFREKKPRVLYPDEEIRRYLRLSGIGEEAYLHVSCQPDREFSFRGITVRPRRVFHDPAMGCYGYEISDEEECIYYSGDSGVVSEEILEELRTGKLSALYLDTAKNAPADSGHGNFEAMKKRIAAEWRNKVTCIHLDCDFRQEITEAGFCGCWQD